MSRSDPATSVAKAAAIFFAGTVFSRLITIFREIVTARTLGGSSSADVFAAAAAVSTLSTNALCFALATIILPKVVMSTSSNSQFGPTIVNATIFSALSGAALIGILAVLSFPLSQLVGQGFSEEQQTFFVQVLFILMPWCFFQVLLNLIGLIYQSMGRMALSSAYSGIENAAVALTLVLMATTTVIQYSYVMSVSAALAIGIISLPLVRFLIEGVRCFSLESLRFYNLRDLILVFFSNMLLQSFVFVERAFASELPTGAVASLFYAKRLIDLPFSLVVGSLIAGLFPKISSFVAEKKFEGLRDLVLKSSRMLCFVLISAGTACVLFGLDTVTFILVGGEFDPSLAEHTGGALATYGVGLAPFGLFFVAWRIFAAIGDLKTPAFVTILGLFILLFLNYSIGDRFGLVGIVACTVAVQVFDWLLLGYLLDQRLKYDFLVNSLKDMAKAASCAIFAAGCQALVSFEMPPFWLLCMRGLVFFSAFFLLAWLFLKKAPRPSVS